MPLIDMPLSELYQYQGINPRPADHDAFWEAALREMHAVDAQVELVPSTFKAPGADCFDLFFTGVHNARIHAKYLRPSRSDAPHPAVVIFHGYSSDSGDWSDKLCYVHLGFSVAALDCRGQGGLSEDTGGVFGNTFKGHIIRGLSDKPENLLFRQIFLDTAQLAGIVMAMPEVDENRVGALGGSQGGGLTLACASLEPRIRKAASMYPFLCDYKRVWDLDLAKDAYEEIRTYFRMFDPMHKRETQIFTTLGYIDVQYLAPRIKADFLMGTGLMDTLCPPSTQFAAYNKITSPKQISIFPDFGHEYLSGFDDQVFQFMTLL
jgi:cephalosporin-C deacetylase